MIVKEEFLGKLRRYFSLNLYEVKIWTALLSRGVSTAGELSDIANVPRSRSYDVLESLEKKGFVIMKPNKPIKYIAVPPEEVLERVKKKIKERSDKQIKLINELKTGEIITELNQLHSQGLDLVQPLDLSGSLRGQENVYNHLESKIKRAKKTVDIITTSEGLLNKADLISAAIKKSKSKPKIRIAAPITKDNISKAKELAKLVEVKHTNKKARFSIIDGKELIFMLIDNEDVHPNYDIGIWVSTEFFSKTLKALFDTEWGKAKPLSQIKV